jgi:hypothetical protein
MQKTISSPLSATVTTYTIGEGAHREVIGRVHAITEQDGTTFWVAIGHDFDADPEDQAKGFVPLHLGVFHDPAEAESLIERRAREARVYDTLPNEQPVTDLFGAAIAHLLYPIRVDVTVSSGRYLIPRDVGRVVALIDAHGPRRAQRASQVLKAALPGASVWLDGTTVRVWVHTSDARKLAEAVLK